MGQESTRDALNRYFTREAKKVSRTKRKNQKPEFEFKKLAVKWLAENGFECDVVESKGVYNFAAGRYDQGKAEAGFADIVGVSPYFGVACFIELKAPGKRYSLKVHQRDFLLRKIKAGAFAICADSTFYIDDIYKCWVALRREQNKFGLEASITFLVECLPKVKELTDNLSDITG